MKKILLAGFTYLALFAVPSIVKAASWTMTVSGDTVYATVDSTASVLDDVTVSTGSVTLKWQVVGTTFPADWLTEAAFGICDNNTCINNTNSTYLWNNTTKSGPVFTSNPYTPTGDDDFHLQLNLKGVSSGTHMVTVNLADLSLNSRAITFVINKPSTTAVQNVTSPESSTILYPNPANNELNVVYDANADVKNIAVYNVIGKVMTVYRVSGNSANLNIESIPSGIYFVRLFNSSGNVVVTRKFTKQ